MQKCKHFRAALTSLLVLYATDRKPVVLIVVVRTRTVVIVDQAHFVRIVAIALRGTPEDRMNALVVVIPIVASVTSRERREPESIRAITTTIPPR